MKNKKNGFTLVEMIVCIAIIAVLGVVIGLNADKLFAGSNISEYEDQMRELMESASIYAELSDTGLNCNYSCDIRLENLVEKGLVDKNIYNDNNPLYAADIKFKPSDVFKVTRNLGRKNVVYKCNATNTLYDLYLSNIDNYKYWGEC